MIKIIIRRIVKFRNILLLSSAILLSGVILVLGWINHRDFDRSIINAELRELLVIAKSAGHDIESGIVGIKQGPKYINKLIQHINAEESFTTFVMDSKHIILSDPVRSHIGRSIIEVGKEALNADELLNLESFIKKMDFNDSGTAILLFPAKGEKPKKEMKLLAFAHLNGENELYSVIVTERLSALTGPIHRNLRDILMLIGLFFIVFSIFGNIFYHIQKKRIQTETASRALEIINKQLHCEIDDYKCIEKSLKNNKT